MTMDIEGFTKEFQKTLKPYREDHERYSQLPQLGGQEKISSERWKSYSLRRTTLAGRKSLGSGVSQAMNPTSTSK
jgi:hypothetical protein